MDPALAYALVEYAADVLEQQQWDHLPPITKVCRIKRLVCAAAKSHWSQAKTAAPLCELLDLLGQDTIALESNVVAVYFRSQLFSEHASLLRECPSVGYCISAIICEPL